MIYAVTKLNSVEVRSLYSCTVCGRMSLLSVMCVCLEFLSWWDLVIESAVLQIIRSYLHNDD